MGFLGALVIAAVSATAAAEVPQLADRAVMEALRQIYRLRDYTAFDWIVGRYERGTLTLEGFARTGTLKDAAESVARKAPGVEEVINRIELLPSHASDDDVRIRAYASIYIGALERYAPGGNLSDATLRDLEDAARVGISSAAIARGPHGIHIIVNGGRVLLLGQVRTTGDRQQAESRVRTLSGVLAVVNQIQVR